jgi:pyruvate ferredoxin oxidoreductase gamma subunit
LRAELAALGQAIVDANLDVALKAFESLAAFHGSVREGPEHPVSTSVAPAWIDLAKEPVSISAPAIRGSRTSLQTSTGAWRVTRPVIDYERCHRCVWVCSTACPDSAISAGTDGAPQIDLEHCKGCMLCVEECPWHAIRAEPEFHRAYWQSEGRP